MKKVFALLIALSLVFSLSAGVTAHADEAFDANLTGAWVIDKAENIKSGDGEELEDLFNNLFFLPDGSFSCAALPFPYVAAMGLEAPKAVTADGVIILNSLADVLSAAANSLFSILPEANKHYAEQIKMITDLRIGYEFFDIPEEGNDDYAPHNDLEKTLFKGSDKDGLKLHIAAIVSEDGLNRQSLEGDCILHKTINEDFMNAYLTGSWSDSNKNYWSFGYGEKDGVPYYQYSVITSTGSLLVSDPGYSPWVHYAGDTVFGSLETNFEGANTIYKIIDLNAETMSLRDDVGEIIMTREWGLF